MRPENMTNEELVRHVDNMPNPTPLEKELAQRMDELAIEITMLEALVPNEHEERLLRESE